MRSVRREDVVTVFTPGDVAHVEEVTALGPLGFRLIQIVQHIESRIPDDFLALEEEPGLIAFAGRGVEALHAAGVNVLGERQTLAVGINEVGACEDEVRGLTAGVAHALTPGVFHLVNEVCRGNGRDGRIAPVLCRGAVDVAESAGGRRESDDAVQTDNRVRSRSAVAQAVQVELLEKARAQRELILVELIDELNLFVLFQAHLSTVPAHNADTVGEELVVGAVDGVHATAPGELGLFDGITLLERDLFLAVRPLEVGIVRLPDVFLDVLLGTAEGLLTLQKAVDEGLILSDLINRRVLQVVVQRCAGQCRKIVRRNRHGVFS